MLEKNVRTRVSGDGQKHSDWDPTSVRDTVCRMQRSQWLCWNRASARLDAKSEGVAHAIPSPLRLLQLRYPTMHKFGRSASSVGGISSPNCQNGACLVDRQADILWQSARVRGRVGRRWQESVKRQIVAAAMRASSAVSFRPLASTGSQQHQFSRCGRLR